MNLNVFLNFLKDNINFFSEDDIKLIVSGRYNELLLKLNNKASTDKKNKKKYEKIINFFIKFIEDLSKNEYKYNYNKATNFKELKYWFDFYCDNKLFSQAENVIKHMQEKNIDPKKIKKLTNIVKNEKQKYQREYKNVVHKLQKENIINAIENMVKSGAFQKALILAIQAIKIYPDDKKFQEYIDKINDLKVSKLDMKLEQNEDILSKVGMLDLLKKNEIIKNDLKQIYKKLYFLLKIKDWENGLNFIFYLRNKLKIEDKKILEYFNKFNKLKNKIQKQQQQKQFNIEIKTIKLMVKNKQYKDALLRANLLLRKYPLVKKKKLFSLIKNIQKKIFSHKKTSKLSKIDRFLMKISPLTKKGLYEFYQKMAWFLKSKMDIKTVLNIIYHQSKDLGLKKFVNDIINGIDAGMSLSESIGFYKQVKQLDLALIKVGENTGKLATVFENIYNAKKEEDRRRKKVKSIMIYPSIVISIAIIIFIGLLIFVIPKFVLLFEGIGVPLPYLTQKILELSNFIKTKWYIIISFIVLFIIFYKLFSKTSWGKYFNSYLVLHLPIIKNIVFKYYLIYFTSYLSILLESGVSIIESLDIIIYGTENILFKNEFTRLKFEIEGGLSLGKAIGIGNIQEIGNYSNKYIPIDVAYAMDIGEKTGQLASLLYEISEKYDEDLKLTIKNLQDLIEPFVIVIVGLVVFLFAVSIFLPLLQMYNAIGHKGGL